MKTPFKILKWVWGAFAAFVVGSIVVGTIMPSHHELARDPNNIEKILKLYLPDIKHVDSEDNMDRGASRWDYYGHDIQFCETLSEDCIRELERRCVEDAKHWKKNDETGCFIYVDENYDEYSVYCCVCSEHASLQYDIDEDEEIWSFLLIMIGFVCLMLASVLFMVLYMAFIKIKEFVVERFRQAK